MGTAEAVDVRYALLRNPKAFGQMCDLALLFNGTNIEGKVALTLRHIRDSEVAKTQVFFTARRWDGLMRVKSAEHIRLGEKGIVVAARIRVGSELSVSSSGTIDTGDAVADVSDECMINMLEALASRDWPCVATLDWPCVGFRFAGDQDEHVIQIANSPSERDARDLRDQLQQWKASRALFMN